MNEEIIKQLSELEKRIVELEKNKTPKLHSHNGIDSNKVKIKDLDSIISIQTTINPGNLADGAGETIQVTGVNGANLGDFVIVSAPYDLQDITVTSYIQANSVIEIRLQNESGGAIDLASGIWRILVFKKII